jgi:Protein of unknown function (DUF3304)
MPNRTLPKLLKFMLPLLLAGMVLSGCAKTSGTVAVSVTAINYTDQELNGAVFEQPDDESKVAGGVPVRPFEGAGLMCCFSLPAKWHKGIKVKLTYDWWQGDDKPRKYETKELEVPPYPGGEAGTLWALFYPDGSVQVVSSNYAPGHAKWPGKIKGGPVPTLEHRRKMWQMDYDEEASLLPYYEGLASGLTEQEVLEKWKYLIENDKAEAARFSGPSDPQFRQHLIQRGRDGVRKIRERLTAMERNKP